MAERYEKALLSGSNFHSAAVMGTDMKRLCFDGTEPCFFRIISRIQAVRNQQIVI